MKKEFGVTSEMKIKLSDYEHLPEMIEETLEEEIEEVNCAISNEKLWAKGSTGEQASQHEMNAEDLTEYKNILQYAIDHKVIWCIKEIHIIWIEQLLENFITELRGMIENNKCMLLDSSLEKDVIDSVEEILEEQFERKAI